jgi:hypothetical protein
MPSFLARAFRPTLSFTMIALALTTALQAQRLIVTAPTGQGRLPEVIELPLGELRKHIHSLDHFKAVDATTHKTLTTQIYPSTNGSSNDLLLIAAQLPANGKLTIDFLPTDETEPQTLVFGRDAPERKDDFAWENEYTAYRVYGPALEATGEITSGIDVWSKRVPKLVIDSFYKHDAEGARTHNPALSYHKDDGVGLDSYLVGPTRGCGGTGIFSAGKLWVSKNYTHLKLLSSGPVRFEFELTYAPWDANGIEVTETKHITLDAGTHMNKITSTFTFAGTQTLNAAAGLPIRAGDLHTLDYGHILSVWDTPQDPTAGKIATGILAYPTEPSSTAQIDGQTLMLFAIHSGQSFTYYAGSGWSKADMPTHPSWDNYLTQLQTQMKHPLSLHWK